MPKSGKSRKEWSAAEKRLTEAQYLKLLLGKPSTNPYHDGGGLYIDLRAAARGKGERRVLHWYYKFAAKAGGKLAHRKIPIGPTSLYDLDQARARHDELRRQQREGRDIWAEYQTAKSRGEQVEDPNKPPFHSLAWIWNNGGYYTKRVVEKCRSERGRDEHIWELIQDAVDNKRIAIVDKGVGDNDAGPRLTQDDVANTVKPYWQADIGKRMRGMIFNMILYASTVLKIPISENPARIQMDARGQYLKDDPLYQKLGGKRKRKHKPHPSLPLDDVPKLIARLKEAAKSGDKRALAALVCIREVKRKDEICDAKRSQIKWRAKAIEIHAAEGKGGIYLHPLVGPVMAIFTGLAQQDGWAPSPDWRDDWLRDKGGPPKDTTIFYQWKPDRARWWVQPNGIAYKAPKAHSPEDQPGRKRRPALHLQYGSPHDQDGSPLDLVDYLRRVAGDALTHEFVAHGFRHCFKLWTIVKRPPVHNAVVELLMGHKPPGSDVEQTYSGSREKLVPVLFDQIRDALVLWNAFLDSGELSEGELVILHRKRAKAYRGAEADAPLVQEIVRMVEAGEPKWQAALKVAPKVPGDAILESKAKRLLNRFNVATGHVGVNARYPASASHYASGLARAHHYPPDHPANALNFTGGSEIKVTMPADYGRHRKLRCGTFNPDAYTLNQAASAAGISRSVMFRAIKKAGDTAARKNRSGVLEINADWLHQTYPQAKPSAQAAD